MPVNIILIGAKGNLGGEIISQNSTYGILPIHRGNWSELAGLSFGKRDFVVHVASDLVSLIHENPSAIIDSNVALTARLLEISKGCGRFVYISSCAVYGDALSTTESTRCQPLSINGIANLLNERIVEEFCSKNEIPYLILRVFNMYGGHDHFSIISKLQHSLKTGVPFQLNNFGIAQRDFVHVSDVANIILKLCRLDLSSGYLNIGTGIATKISEILSVTKINYPKLKIINKTTQEVEYSRADITKLLGIIDYKFMDIYQQLSDLMQGIGRLP